MPERLLYIDMKRRRGANKIKMTSDSGLELRDKCRHQDL